MFGKLEAKYRDVKRKKDDLISFVSVSAAVEEVETWGVPRRTQRYSGLSDGEKNRPGVSAPSLGHPNLQKQAGPPLVFFDDLRNSAKNLPTKYLSFWGRPSTLLRLV